MDITCHGGDESSSVEPVMAFGVTRDFCMGLLQDFYKGLTLHEHAVYSTVSATTFLKKERRMAIKVK